MSFDADRKVAPREEPEEEEGADVPRKRRKYIQGLPKSSSRPPDDSTVEERAVKPDYYFENGLRKVRPYWFSFKAYAKRRWLGRNIVELCNEEFHPKHPEFFANAVKLGRLTVNGKKVERSYELKDLDLVEHAVHRHELPVLHVPVEIVLDKEDVLVVDKPCSIPVHATGKYRCNSLAFLLYHEFGYKNLRTLHRLDRTTSGLLIFAKNLELDRRMKKAITERAVKKEYLAKVDGVFPEGEIVCEEPLERLVPSMGVQFVFPSGKECLTRFRRLSTDGTHSLVSCFPETGRTHQIRVHLQYLGYPIVNDVIYNSQVFGPQRGKGGDYGRSVEELKKAVAAEHSFEKWADELESAPRRIPVVEEGKDYSELLQNPDYDPFCPDCIIKSKDPPEEHLRMYLHCLRYTGPDFCYETKPPPWAPDDLSGCSLSKSESLAE